MLDSRVLGLFSLLTKMKEKITFHKDFVVAQVKKGFLTKQFPILSDFIQDLASYYELLLTVTVDFYGESRIPILSTSGCMPMQVHMKIHTADKELTLHITVGWFFFPSLSLHLIHFWLGCCRGK